MPHEDNPPPPRDGLNNEDRLFFPAVARNREPLLEAFKSMVGERGSVLEIGSGSGEHGAYIAGALSGITWQPSDPDAKARKSIAIWAGDVPDGRMLPPLNIHVDQERWWEGLDRPNIIQSANMIHIAPRQAMEGLIKGAGELLPTDGILLLYGPFFRNGTAVESNMHFDADLKSRNPAWGIRDLDRDVIPLADQAGLTLREIKEMPANNLTVTFRRR